MSDHHDNHRPTATPTPDSPDADRASPVQGRSRRHLFKAGLATVPLIVTLRSQPAWGQEIRTNGPLTPISDAINRGASPEEVARLRQQLEEAERSASLEGGSWWSEPSGGGEFGEEGL